MNRLGAALGMEFRLISVYGKSYYLMPIFGLGLGLFLREIAAFQIMTMLFLTTLMVMAFAIEEKNHTDLLYFTLGIDRQTAVAGRYAFNLLFFFASLLFILLGSLLLWAVFPFMETTPIQSLATLGPVSFAALLLLAIQLPGFYQFGYSKAKALSVLPVPLIAGGTALFMNSDSMTDALAPLFRFAAAHPMLLGFALPVLGLVIYGLSYLISVWLYGRKDL